MKRHAAQTNSRVELSTDEKEKEKKGTHAFGKP